MKIEVSYGEVVDKYTILKIKYEKALPHTEAYSELKKEYDYLNNVVNGFGVNQNIIDLLYNTNLILWGIEDEIRLCEKNKCFDQKFVELARAVYKTNDRRFKFKNEINKMYNSHFKEQKMLPEY